VPCFRCGRLQDDPKKGPSPWARAVVAGEQILVCPECQQTHPAWVETAERCPRCGSHKLSIQVGFRVCRACGLDWEPAR